MSWEALGQAAVRPVVQQRKDTGARGPGVSFKLSRQQMRTEKRKPKENTHSLQILGNAVAPVVWLVGGLFVCFEKETVLFTFCAVLSNPNHLSYLCAQASSATLSSSGSLRCLLACLSFKLQE